MFTLKSWLRLAVGIVAICLIAVDSAHAQRGGGHGGGGSGGGSALQIVDLHPSGYDESEAWAINRSGIIVGDAAIRVDGGGLERTAGFWDATQTVPTFTSLKGGISAAEAINDAGAIVGWGLNGDTGSGTAAVIPRYWASVTAEPIDLPIPADFYPGVASGISDDGIVTGEIYQSVDGRSVGCAVAWRVSQGSVFGPVMLAPAAAGNDVATLESGINRVVGRSADPVLGFVATAWDLLLFSDGSFSVIGSTTLIADETGEASAITATGGISGHVQSWNDAAHTTEHIAFVIRNDSVAFLASGGRNYFGDGLDLNDTDVVGETGHTLLSNPTATLWNVHNKRLDLAQQYFDETWSFTSAQGINPGGNIVGYGKRGVEAHAWVLR